MDIVAITLLTLVPVLGIGACLVELLLRTAPRRGKRPDIHDFSTSGSVQVAVEVAMEPGAGASRQILRGTPRQVVYRLLLSGWGNPWCYRTSREANTLLRTWEEEGRLTVRSYW